MVGEGEMRFVGELWVICFLCLGKLGKEEAEERRGSRDMRLKGYLVC